MFTIECTCCECEPSYQLEVMTVMDFDLRTVHIDWSDSDRPYPGVVLSFEALRDALDRGVELIGPFDRWGRTPFKMSDRLWTPETEHGEMNRVLSKYLTKWCALGFPAYLADMTYNKCCGGGFDDISKAFLADTPHFKSLAAIAEDELLKTLKW